ncbi:hypothetical protein NUW58_g10673 [Xylaria curta]|uniref:Uncharacterized protein n=1 Tax=Xylaria curta TaxID=42375 RepID=A0ACC1MI37_9PEZI|nr:hypothetical protein NUW58_g10673 [Xylaria curta]
MGAATGTHLLFNLEEPIGAFMGFSARCPFAGRSLNQMREVLGLEHVPHHDNVLRNTPVLLEHCADDPLVLIQNGRGLRDTLRGRVSVDYTRVNGAAAVNINFFFNRLEAPEVENIPPDHFFNVDEMGIARGVGGDHFVVTDALMRQTLQKSNEKGEWITTGLTRDPKG